MPQTVADSRKAKYAASLPRNELGGMRRVAAIMVEKTLFEISRASYVLLFRVRFGSEEINVMHDIHLSPPRHVIKLACQPWLASRGGPPSLKLQRTLQPSL